MGSSGQFVLRILKHKSLNLNMPGKDDDRIDMTNEGDDEDSALGGCVGTFLWIISMFLIVITFPLSLFVTMKQVKQYERAVILRLGKLKKGGPFGPGLFFVVPCLDDIVTVDLRTVTFDVPPQEILTKDSVTVAVDAVVYFKVYNPMKSVVNVANASQSTRLLASTTLRNILGTKNLHDILSDREEIAKNMLTHLDEATDDWGIRVERVEVKDVRLPQQLQRAMAAEAEAFRQARAKVIEAEGEQKASKALKDASDIISASPAALQLRYLQTLSAIAAERNSTIVFPLPIELMGSIMQNLNKDTNAAIQHQHL